MNDQQRQKLAIRAKKRRARRNRLLLLLIGLCLIFFAYKLVAARSSSKLETPSKQATDNNRSRASKDPEEAGKNNPPAGKDDNNQVNSKPREFRIKAGGDILYHTPLLKHARKANGKSYAFDDQYALIKDFMADADYTVANFEGTHNPKRAYSGYPTFNSPKELIEELKRVGFDGLTTANNHSLDSRYKGVLTTLETINQAGMDNFGTQENEEDKIKVVDVDGVKLSILAYTDSLNGLDFLLDTEEKMKSVNKIDARGEGIKEDIEKARKMGADIVIIYPHWGDEYAATNRPEYVKLARKMVDWGADAVLGNHPHVVQPSEWYTSQDGRKGFIIYSIGNFISNQVKETIGDYRVEHSVVLELIFDVNPGEKSRELKDVKFHPIWLKRTRDKKGGFLHQPVLAKDYMEGGPKADSLNSQELKRATRAYKATMKTLTSPVQ